jgi:hypothetical protein
MSTQQSRIQSDVLESPWLTSKEAGDYLGYSDWSMRDFAKRRLVKHSRLPGVTGGYRFKREWLDAFMEARAIEPKQSMRLPEKPVLKLVPSLAETNPELHAAMERARKRMAKQGKAVAK